jgi:hypothetical protein
MPAGIGVFGDAVKTRVGGIRGTPEMIEIFLCLLAMGCGYSQRTEQREQKGSGHGFCSLRHKDSS